MFGIAWLGYSDLEMQPHHPYQEISGSRKVQNTKFPFLLQIHIYMVTAMLPPKAKGRPIIQRE